MTDEILWWQSTEPRIQRLARAIAVKHAPVNPDAMAMPYIPPLVDTPSGQAYLLPDHDQRPVWTYYITVAYAALEAAGEAEINEALGDQLPVAFNDPAPPLTPDQKWRQDNGLDADPTEGV